MSRTIMLLTLGAALGMAMPVMAQDDAAAALANPDAVSVRNVSRIELSPGMAIVDDSGKSVGTVKRTAGNTIVLTDGRVDYLVPITEFYAYREGAVDHFATRLPKSELAVSREGA